MKLYQYLSAFSLVLMLCTTASIANSLDGESTSKEVVARGRSGISELLSFDSFSQIFGKNYSSPVQRMVRMKYYMANLFKIFNSMVEYENRERDSYLGVNQMSDWSPEEVEKLYIPRAILEEGIVGSDENNATSFNEQGNESKSRVKRGILEMAMSLGDWEPDMDETGLPDEVHIDHRQSGCFLRPRSQGNCGACYIFSAISLYEWIHCYQTRQRMAFSEQYVVDCGNRYGLRGCERGNPIKVSSFVAACGLESRTKYPYMARPNQCPYGSNTPEKFMGQYRVNDARLKLRSPHEITKYLEISPLLVEFASYRDFHLYSGGVDNPNNCDPNRGHTMLLVGHGRENGHQYWILRNSFGEQHGEGGYYRLRRSANCFMLGGHSYSPQAISKKLEGQLFLTGENPNYDEDPVDELREEFEGMNDQASRMRRLLNDMERELP